MIDLKLLFLKKRSLEGKGAGDVQRCFIERNGKACLIVTADLQARNHLHLHADG